MTQCLQRQTLLEARMGRKLSPGSNKAKLVDKKIAGFIMKCFKVSLSLATVSSTDISPQKRLLVEAP